MLTFFFVFVPSCCGCDGDGAVVLRCPALWRTLWSVCPGGCPSVCILRCVLLLGVLWRAVSWGRVQTCLWLGVVCALWVGAWLLIATSGKPQKKDDGVIFVLTPFIDVGSLHWSSCRPLYCHLSSRLRTRPSLLSVYPPAVPRHYCFIVFSSLHSVTTDLCGRVLFVSLVHFTHLPLHFHARGVFCWSVLFIH